MKASNYDELVWCYDVLCNRQWRWWWCWVYVTVKRIKYTT